MNTFKSVEQGIASRLTKLTGQYAKQRAIGRAFAAFEKKHPNWASSMFDKHFGTLGSHGVDSTSGVRQ